MMKLYIIAALMVISGGISATTPQINENIMKTRPAINSNAKYDSPVVQVASRPTAQVAQPTALEVASKPMNGRGGAGQIMVDPSVARRQANIAQLLADKATTDAANKRAAYDAASKPSMVEVASKPAVVEVASKPAVVEVASKPSVQVASKPSASGEPVVSPRAVIPPEAFGPRVQKPVVATRVEPAQTVQAIPDPPGPVPVVKGTKPVAGQPSFNEQLLKKQIDMQVQMNLKDLKKAQAAAQVARATPPTLKDQVNLTQKNMETKMKTPKPAPVPVPARKAMKPKKAFTKRCKCRCESDEEKPRKRKHRHYRRKYRRVYTEDDCEESRRCKSEDRNCVMHCED